MLTLALSHQTWAHRISVEPKLVFLCVVMVTVMQVRELPHMIAVLAAVIALYISLGRASLRPALIGLRPLVFVVVAIMGFHTLVGQFELGAIISLRIFAMVGLANFVTMTTQMSDLIAAVERIVKPVARLGLNPQVLGLAMALFVRYVPVLRARSEALTLAWRARSHKRMNALVIVPLVLAALDDADHLADALRARGAIKQTKDNWDKK